MRIRGQYSTSPVIAGAKGKPLFPLPWYSNSSLTTRVDSCVLSLFDLELIQVRECFHTMESSILINRDYEDENGVEEYLGMEKYFLI